MWQLTFLQDYKTQFFHLSLNQNRSTCKRVLLWKVGGSVSCVKSPSVRIFFKMPPFLIHLVNQTDFSQQKQVWFPSWVSQSATLHFERRIWFKFQSAGFLPQNPDFPKIKKNYWLMSIINLVSLCNYKQTFFQKGLNKNLYSVKGAFDCKTIDIDSCYKMLIV